MGKAMPVQVADQPASPCMRFHIAKESHQLRIRHMMRDLAGDDEIERLWLVQIIACAILDREIGRRCAPRCLQAFLVEIDTDQFGLDTPPTRPPGDGAQNVSIAKSDVE
jgi:hypothetical protein